jgi:hypothetical protein
VELLFTTINGNFASSGSGIWSLSGIIGSKGTLIANNPPANCFLASPNLVHSYGYNLADDASCSLSGTGDLSNAPAGVDPSGLQNNGGPTRTVALLPNSPAVDHIPPGDCTDVSGNPVATDQRSFLRPENSGCDIGSYELLNINWLVPSLIVQAIPGSTLNGLVLSSELSLARGSDGINPPTEPVRLAVGPYTAAIPVGSFQQVVSPAGQLSYVFTGNINGAAVGVTIALGSDGAYQLAATASPVDLRGISNPVPVSIIIGNDAGATAINALLP